MQNISNLCLHTRKIKGLDWIADKAFSPSRKERRKDPGGDRLNNDFGVNFVLITVLFNCKWVPCGGKKKDTDKRNNCSKNSICIAFSVRKFSLKNVFL